VSTALDVNAQLGDAQTVMLQFIDISGHLKGVSISRRRFESVCAEGQWIDGSSLDSFVRMRESDMLLHPDLSTIAVLPWQESGGFVARVICDVTTTAGRRFAGDPRYVLQRAVEIATNMGYNYYVAPEIEFFICSSDAQGRLQPLSSDRCGYFDLDADPATQLRHAIVEALVEIGINVESSHHEVATGQHEIDLAPMPAQASADALVTLKYVAHHIAKTQGLAVTFMPKPFNAKSGSGLHIHQFLKDSTNQTNLFSGSGHQMLSEVGQQFVAGQLHYAAAYVALISPLVNSYKRLASGFEAPTTVSWARENRSAFVRVPSVPVTHPEYARAEIRGSDPSCNPYLALAALLRAGLTGINEHLMPPQPVEEYVYAFDDDEHIPLGSTRLPLSLGDALNALGASPLMQETLGEYVFSRYMEMKRREWRKYQMHVTDWELEMNSQTI
jgi:glutamine synthetase